MKAVCHEAALAPEEGGAPACAKVILLFQVRNPQAQSRSHQGSLRHRLRQNNLLLTLHISFVH